MKAIESSVKSYLPFAQKLGLGLLLQRTQRTQNFEGDGESSTSDSYSFREATEVELPSYAMAIVCSYVLQRFPRLQD